MRLPGSRPSATEADVVVAGGGVPALACALEFASRGAGVIVVAAGPTAAPPLGLILLGSGRPYVAVARAVSRASAQLAWAAGCENHLRARAFLDPLGARCGYVARGSFLLARSRQEAEELEESEDMLREDGFAGEFLDHYMFETRFDVPGFAAAYWAAEDAQVEPASLRAALEEAARAKGVAFSPGRARALRAGRSFVEVELETGRLRGGSAVVAAEAGAAELVPELAPLLHASGRGALSVTLLAGARLPGALRTADGRVAWQEQDGSLLLAETAAPNREADPTAEGDPIGELASRLPVASRVGSFDGPPLAPDGARGGEVTLDGLPALGLLPGRPVAVACGFGRLACGFAFAAARFAADALLRGTDPTPEPLRATRVPRAY